MIDDFAELERELSSMEFSREDFEELERELIEPSSAPKRKPSQNHSIISAEIKQIKKKLDTAKAAQESRKGKQ